MTPFVAASKFFHACESLEGWSGCQTYVAAGARFECQAEVLADVTTVQAYTEWLRGLGSGPLKGCRYEVAQAAWDEATRTALFVATFIATHVGEGGPVPPTAKRTTSHYVYTLHLDADDKVDRMVKIWNAGWALKELGWA